MVAVQHLTWPATLAAPTSDIPSLSILSYNVLLPNSEDGWWTYKMYDPPLRNDEDWKIASWDHRRDLLKNRIQMVNADVVCLQEVSPESFQKDFAFMKELGYDGVELFKKGRFRPATFYKSSTCRLASPAVHKDRCLLTAFQTETSKQHWHVVNVHLQAGKQGPRRVRQMNEAVRGALTLAKKLKEPQPDKSIQLIVCGDMNGDAECGAVRYLEDGFVDDKFLEDNEAVTSSRKALPLATPMIDVAGTVQREGIDAPPPTLVVAELMSNLMEVSTYDKPVLSQNMIDRLGRVYKRLATNENGEMSLHDVNQWLIKINHEVGRGDEFRNAAKEMGWEDPKPEESWEERKKRVKLPEGGVLTLEGFIRVYQKELDGGKFWGIAHDMAILDDPLPNAGLYTARFDRIYCSAVLQPTAVLDVTANKPCPNDQEPSDHLPVAATFQPKQT